MRVLTQRVSRASVSVAGECIASIDRGLLLLIGFRVGDNVESLKYLAHKVVNLRIFDGEDGRLHNSVLDIKGEILAVPQFTLNADTRKGRRPDFTKALSPPEASYFFNEFVTELERELGRTVETGKFGAYMLVDNVNDGPFTIMLSHPTE